MSFFSKFFTRKSGANNLPGLKELKNGRSFTSKTYSKGAFGSLQKATNAQLRARVASGQGANVSLKAKEAMLKYNECGCEELKKRIDAEKAGLFARVGAVKSLGLKALFTGTKGELEAKKLEEANKRVAKASEAAEAKFKEMQDEQVRAGVISRELADKALSEYAAKVKERKNAVEEAKKANNAANAKSKKNLNNAKLKGYKAANSPYKTESAKARENVRRATANVNKAASAVKAVVSRTNPSGQLLLMNGKLNTVAEENGSGTPDPSPHKGGTRRR